MVKVFINFRHDVGKKELDFKFLIPKVSLACDYEIKGKILVLPIEGNGYLEINAGKLPDSFKCFVNFFIIIN